MQAINSRVKKIFLLAMLLMGMYNSFSQRRGIDSIENLLTSVTNKKMLAEAHYHIAELFLPLNYDSSLDFASKSFKAATAANNKEYCCKSQLLMGDASYFKQDYPNSIHNYLGAYEFAEDLNDETTLQGVISRLSDAYYDAGDYENSIAFLKLSFAQKLKKGTITAVNDLCQIGYLFTELNKLDSAQIYYDESHKLAVSTRSRHLPYIITGLGIINQKSKNFPVALAYYQQALDSCIATGDLHLGYQVLCRIARLYNDKNYRQHSIDSCNQYYGFARYIFDTLTALSSDWPKRRLDFYKEMASYYGSVDSNETALKYYKLASHLEDSLFSYSSTRTIQAYTIGADQERLKRQKERQHRIENALIGAGIIVFIFLFFLLSRSIHVNQLIIKILAALMLLLAFEFLNLVLHPILEKITKESQWQMLGTLAITAGLLIPLHHILEKWVIAVAIKKNKAIKMATIKKLRAEVEQPDEPNHEPAKG